MRCPPCSSCAHFVLVHFTHCLLSCTKEKPPRLLWGEAKAAYCSSGILPFLPTRQILLPLISAPTHPSAYRHLYADFWCIAVISVKHVRSKSHTSPPFVKTFLRHFPIFSQFFIKKQSVSSISTFKKNMCSVLVSVVFKRLDKSKVEEQFASASERNSEPRGNGAAPLRQAVE